jgi:hypothetical protein
MEQEPRGASKSQQTGFIILATVLATSMIVGFYMIRKG